MQNNLTPSSNLIVSELSNSQIIMCFCLILNIICILLFVTL